MCYLPGHGIYAVSLSAGTLWLGMRPPTLLLPITISLASCASPLPTADLNWAGFVASFAGEARIDRQYGNATAKEVTNADVAASLAGGDAKFERWCASHRGKAFLTQAPDHHNAVVSRFHQALRVDTLISSSEGP